MDVTHWREQEADASPEGAEGQNPDPELEAFRRRLEGLL
jgi:hypothetical protein